VNLLDTLPATVIYQEAVPAPTSVSGNILEWNLGDMASDAVQEIRIEVEIPTAVTHGTLLTNTATVYASQTDSRPSNNSYRHSVEVRDDVDLTLTKSGVGQPAIGEHYQYFLNYANWGGAPAASVVITDTLPPEVNFLSANPAPDSTNGNLLIWNVGSLIGNQWGGQIEITAEIASTGTVVNTAEIDFPDLDVDPINNSDDHSEIVNAILPPLITQPTQGTTDTTPVVKGQAPANAVVELWDISVIPPTSIMSTTANNDGDWSVNPTFVPGSISLAAKATKAGLTSDYSNSASITVDSTLDLDPDFVRISSDDVVIAAGVVRAERRTLAFRQLDIEAVLNCPTAPSAHLYVTENGLFNYVVPPTALTNQGGSQWLVEFRLWLSDPHSTYDIWLEWTCNDVDYRENLLFILIDPDGYVYDQSLVDGGAVITDSLVLSAVVTTFVKINDTWQMWPAHVYGQSNPQSTDGVTEDGVPDPGYYSFLTPPGQYRIAVTADGFQPYQSPVLTVISDPIHLDIDLTPVTGGSGQIQAPVNLSRSGKWVDQTTAWLGDVLTYDIWLFNDGSIDTEFPIDVVDALQGHTAYVDSSLNLEEGAGVVAYVAVSDEITWHGVLAGQTAVHYRYQVEVTSTPGTPFDISNSSTTDGYLSDVYTLPSLTAVTHIQNVIGVSLESNETQSADPGETVFYQHTITNSGNTTDTFSFSALSSAGWAYVLPTEVTLGAGESAAVSLEVTVPGGSLYGTIDNTVLTAVSAAHQDTSTSVTDQTTVNRVVALSLSSAAPQAGDAGTTVTYTHQVQNLGNGSDTFVITAVSSQGWSVSHSANPTLAAGASTDIEVYVNIPANAADQMVDQTTVTITSQADGTKTAVGTDSTTALKTDFFVYLPMIVKTP
jgi:uncharacterized repeat protein (TIGR01451 family)